MLNVPGAEWINKFLPKRRPNRGDVVAGLAVWGFVLCVIYMLGTGLFGGSTFHITAFGAVVNLIVPKTEIMILTGFCLPLIVGLIKAWSPTDKPKKDETCSTKSECG